MADLEFDPLRGMPPERDTPKSARGLAVAVAALVLVILLGIWLFLRPHRPAEPRGAATESGLSAPAEPTPPQAAHPTPQVAPAQPGLPELGQSDAFVRALAAELFASPELDRWLAAGDELVLRAVRAILAISERRSARRFLDFLSPEERFAVSARGNGLIIAPENDRRYDRLVEVFVGLDGRKTVRFLSLLDPLVSRAMDEDAFPGTGFDVTLASAIGHLLATPLPAGELAVVRGEDALYRFADPTLEGLSASQKQLLRIGPSNGARVREKLAELARLLSERDDIAEPLEH